MLSVRQLPDAGAIPARQRTCRRRRPCATCTTNSSRGSWDEIRDFLALHYRFNTRLDTPFWQHCRADVDVSGVQDLLDFYEENGPTGFCRHLIGNRGQEMGVHSAFGVEGYLVILTGNRVPYKNMHIATDEERQRWGAHLANLAEYARGGMTVEESLASIRSDAVY